MAFGPTRAITTAIILISGYLVTIFSVMAMSGGFMTMFLHNYFHAFPTWTWPFFVVFVGLAAFLMVRGVHISMRWAGVFFVFEFTCSCVVSIIALIQHAGHLTLHPFNPHYLSSGFKGLGLGFPLAVYLFIGWENSATLAEETDNPRKNMPRALFASVALMLVSFVLFAYATVEGFGENVAALTAVADPVHHGGRQRARRPGLPRLHRRRDLDGRLPDRRRELAGAPDVQLRPRRSSAGLARPGLRAAQTPVNALVIFIGIGLVLVFAWAWASTSTRRDLFAEPSTLGTILVIVVYSVANLSLPVFYRSTIPTSSRRSGTSSSRSSARR